jgi:hypothetical protein
MISGGRPSGIFRPFQLPNEGHTDEAATSLIRKCFPKAEITRGIK